MSNSPQHCDVLGPGDLRFSDRKIVQYGLFEASGDFAVGHLKKTFDWTKPEGISTETWRSTLQTAWNMENNLSVNWDELGVESWDLYMTALIIACLKRHFNSSLTQVTYRLRNCVLDSLVPFLRDPLLSGSRDSGPGLHEKTLVGP